jgi:hypothetical protein
MAIWCTPCVHRVMLRTGLPPCSPADGPPLREDRANDIHAGSMVCLAIYAYKCSQPKGTRRAMKAIIPAAGLGTRFLPATRCMPKELLPVLDKPILQYVVEEALEPEGVDGVVIVNSREKPEIERVLLCRREVRGTCYASGARGRLRTRIHEASTLACLLCLPGQPARPWPCRPLCCRPD